MSPVVIVLIVMVVLIGVIVVGMNAFVISPQKDTRKPAPKVPPVDLSSIYRDGLYAHQIGQRAKAEEDLQREVDYILKKHGQE